MNKLTKVKYIIAEKLNKLYAKRLNEQINPFTNPPPGAGTGPNWAAAAAAWDDWANNQGNAAFAPQPPQAFLNRMSTMGCPGKQNRFNVLMNKWSTLFAPAQGQIIAPNNPKWQSQLASKILWLSDDLQNNC
tara:strand:+ start:1704 stop:2099 length:396 start_codon:yes stop_codon:yes gene_type:complete